ncbi:MAG: tetratricopeptide repeat protein [Deltaproteobacteria bacterium]|nr:tetratricopeptide repeat protein [Deltaproteobacteria bacterium]
MAVQLVVCPRCGRRSPARAAACAFCGAALGRPATPAAPAPSFYERALEAHGRGKSREALELFEQGLGATPPGPAHAQLWRGKAEVLLATGRRVEALRCFDKAIEIDATDREAWLSRAHVLAQQGKREEALKSVDRALQFAPKHEAARKLRAELISAGQAAAQAAAAAPAAPTASSTAAPGSASEAARAHVSLPGGTPALGMRALPATGDPLLEQAQALLDKGRPADALPLVDQVLAQAPRAGHGLLLRAQCLVACKKWEDAPAAFERALQVLTPGEPMATTARFQQGQVLADLGRTAEAVRCFEEAAIAAPNAAEIWFAKGAAELRSGFREDAQRSLSRFLSLAPPRLATQIAQAQEWLQRMQ